MPITSAITVRYQKILKTDRVINVVISLEGQKSSAETKDWDQSWIRRPICGLSRKLRLTNFVSPNSVTIQSVTRWHRRVCLFLD